MLEASDPQAAAELRAQASEQYNNWKEGGALRVLAHTVIGGLTGDLSGALGAGSSELAAGKLNELTDNLPAGVRQAVGAGLAAGLGYLTGGNSGMSAAVNQDFNNRQLHDGQKAFLAELAGNDQEKYYLLYAAACSIMKCSEEFATDSSSYAIYSQLESIGNSPALKPYRDLLNNSYITTYDTVDDGLGTIVPLESRVKLFDYNAGDKALDYINRVDNTYHVTIRGKEP